MPLRFPAALAALALLAGCAGTPTRQPAMATTPTGTPTAAAVPANDNLNAVAWTQTAIERELIYLQTYRDAQSRLLAALHDPG